MFLNLKTCYEKRIFLTCNFMVCLLNFLPKQLSCWKTQIIRGYRTANSMKEVKTIDANCTLQKPTESNLVPNHRHLLRILILWKDEALFNCTQRLAKKSAHSTPIRPLLIAVGAFHCGCSRSELWIIKLLAFKRAKVPKPHKNQTNNMVHQKNNLTPVGPLWCVLGTGALWLLSW